MQEAGMERKSSHILRWAGAMLGLTLLISLAVVAIGLLFQWNTPVQFSNGFFVAGALMIVMGILSVAGGFQQRTNFPLMYAQSAGQASISERTQRMLADIRQGYGTMIVMAGTGLLLIITAIAIHQLLS
jgi:hypothetical protein